MLQFDYLKTAIKQKGCTLQQVADASGMTKGYFYIHTVTINYISHVWR